MAEESPGGPDRPKHTPFVPAETTLREFTVRALVVGLVLCVVLGAANAYLGLKAGMTIAATYPAAVIGMALMRILRGNILEENFTRTVGSIGESVAAGAVFTIPAFILAGVWTELHYLTSTAIMMLGGVLGVFFVTVLRRAMVEDRELPYPESVAAAEIHKAGRAGGTGAAFLLLAGVVGGIVECLKRLHLFAESWSKFVPFARYDSVATISGGTVKGSGGVLLSSPGVSPAFLGVGYIIGPRLASLSFSGGVLAWGLLVPILLFFIGPNLGIEAPGGDAAVQADPQADLQAWAGAADATWKQIVRPMAIGGMLLSAAFTLWRMRANLIGGIKRSVGDVRRAAAGEAVEEIRTERDLRFRWVILGISVCAVLTFGLYWTFTGDVFASFVAAVVMIVAGFFFAAVSGYLVGLIGSSNNPISGLTLSTVVIAALLMVALGATGVEGIATVLGVAGVICVSAAVAGEMLQDLKVGHILGGTPWKMQLGDIIGVLLAASVMYFPLLILHEGNIKAGGIGFGDAKLAAPQASLIAMVAKGIVGGELAWPLLIIGVLLAVALILIQVKSPMLIFVGMYLPLEITFAIFIGGLFRALCDKLAAWWKLNAAQRTRVENTGVLLAAGLIAGEALVALCFAGFQFFDKETPLLLDEPTFGPSILVFVAVGLFLTLLPLKRAGSPDEPAPPSAMM